MLGKKLNISHDNIQKGTDGFNQNMEAIKHSFLFRGYFKKQEWQKEKEKAIASNTDGIFCVTLVTAVDILTSLFLKFK